MPRTTASTSNILSIRLEDPRHRFSAGDTIIGAVARQFALVSPHANVKIQLHGRSKSHMTVSNGQSSTTYRGRCNFFDPREMTQTIFEGPLHIPAGQNQQEWPFAITIPAIANPKAINNATNNEEMCFLPLDAETVSSQVLPPTFYARDIGFWSTSHHSFVEYWLHAEMRYTRDGHSEVKEADLPINVRAASAEAAETYTNLKMCRVLRVVSSHRLVPGMENAELSFHQKSRKFFGSSKVPRFAFGLQIDYPTTIQLDNPRTIPFRIRAVPDWPRTSKEIVDVPQTIKLRGLELEIHANTAIKCVGTWHAKTADDTDKQSLNLYTALAGLKNPVLIPFGEKVEPCDFGALLNLRLDAQGRAAHAREPARTTERFHPSFTTWNIKHTHQLKWRVRMSIADEDASYEATTPLTVLAPSSIVEDWAQPPRDEAWIQPPTDGDAPPAFDQIEKEGEILEVGAPVADGKHGEVNGTPSKP
ncbi:hypothetical protein ACHAQA_008488 [Verticillium albo-atrum]